MTQPLPIALGLLVSLAATEPAQAQDPPEITPIAQFRPRFEADTGRDFASGGEVAFVTHRARLGAELAWEDLDLAIVFQDVRAWGEETDTRRDRSGEGIDVSMALLTWRLGDHVTLRLGRSEVSVQRERLIASAAWRQPGRLFNGFRADFDFGTWNAELGGFLILDGDRRAFDVSDQVLPGDGDATLWFARGGRRGEHLSVDAIVVVSDRVIRDGEGPLSVTMGHLTEASKGRFSGHVESYVQAGRANPDVPHLAAMAGAQVTLALDVSEDTPAFVSAGHDWLSGDRAPTDGRSSQFDTLYGANHRYYGTMDVMVFRLGGPADSAGLHNTWAAFSMGDADHVQAGVTQHLFTPSVAMPAVRSTETDLVVTAQVHRAVHLSAGAGWWTGLSSADLGSELFAWAMVDVAWNRARAEAQ